MQQLYNSKKWTNWLDLNFTKILWGDAKRAVQKQMSANLIKLKQCWKESWTKIPQVRNWSGPIEMATEKIPETGIFHTAFHFGSVFNYVLFYTFG